MKPDIANKVVKNVNLLISSADILDIPIIHTEQYPQGLGKTLPEIQNALKDYHQPVEKNTFSCCREDIFNSRIAETGRKQVILTGAEAHICILQTALDLLTQNYTVYIASDAVCSRRKLDWETGLKLADRAGVIVATTEILIFQLLTRADTGKFKRIQKLLK